MELFNTEQRMTMIMDNLINEQLKEANHSDSVFLLSYKDKFLLSFRDSIQPKIINVYDKYLSDQEIKYLYNAYSSDIGKEAFNKVDKMWQELMIIGMQYGGEIVDQVSAELQENEDAEVDYKMNNEFSGCQDFKTGKFKQVINDSVTYFYQRNDTTQIETYGEGKSIFKINWLNDCRYILTLIETNNPYAQDYIGFKMTVNIYDTKNDSCKFMYHYDNDENIYEGELIKIE
jgi:hypothetical protein